MDIPVLDFRIPTKLAKYMTVYKECHCRFLYLSRNPA